MAKYTESDLEQATIEWLEELEYSSFNFTLEYLNRVCIRNGKRLGADIIVVSCNHGIIGIFSKVNIPGKGQADNGFIIFNKYGFVTDLFWRKIVVNRR